GISWGGFNSLQLAARRPPALRAIITCCASDDRYSDDVHYRGGCVLAVDMLQWAVSMLTWNALPPDPAAAGEAWRDEWRHRVEATPAFIEAWMSHQLRDDYWRHGSVCEDYSAIEVPVFAVGGWSDGYVDAVLRLLAGLPGRRKGLIGPWSHAFPNHSVPGPEIGWFAEALRWWDRWLKGMDNGVDSEPMLCAYIQDYTAPAAHHPSWPGRFVTLASWPPPPSEAALLSLSLLAAPHAGQRGFLGPPGSSPASPASPGSSPASPESPPGDGTVLWHRGAQDSGLDAGALTADGGHGDWPGDQRGEDGRSLSFDSAALGDEIEILGNAEAFLELSSDRPTANVIVRLCDVAPTGESLLVTRGMLNLTHREGHDKSVPLEPATPVTVRVPLKAIGHRFAAGHRIRLAVQATYWPWIWPAAANATLGLACGQRSRLELPLRPQPPGEEPAVTFGPPERVEPIAHEVLAARPTSRRVVTDLASSSSSLVFDWDVGGRVLLTESGLEYDGSNITTYTIAAGDPLSAEVSTQQSAALRRAGELDVLVETSGRMTADAQNFLVTLSIDAREAGARVMGRRWTLSFPRNGN
ncbi:MAG: CocE/NonD family hydrolase, partial [Acidimicrobiales bacterium]